MNSLLVSRFTTKIKDNLKYRFIWPFEDSIYFKTLDDEAFTRRMYRRVFDKELNLKNPRTFNEKLNYLKLYNRNPAYTRLADKLAVRDYVAQKGFAHILNPIYGVFDRVEEIDINSLPDAFVIKATHGSGWNIICPDKRALDWPAEVKKMRRWLRKDFYSAYREWVYKGIPPRLIIEKYLDAPGGLTDYKFFCFNGRPEFVQVDVDRFTEHHRNFYDFLWNLLPFEFGYPAADRSIDPPANLAEMLSVSRTLSEGFPFLRVDLYDHAGQILFGELTFFPDAGFAPFEPADYDVLVGEKLKLPQIANKKEAG